MDKISYKNKTSNPIRTHSISLVTLASLRANGVCNPFVVSEALQGVVESIRTGIICLIFFSPACLAEEPVVCENNISGNQIVELVKSEPGKTEIDLTEDKNDQEKDKDSDKKLRSFDEDDAEEPFEHFSFYDSELFGSSSLSNSLTETGTEPIDEYTKENRSVFYKNYIEKYYPKAFVIQEKFMQMTKPDDLAAAVNDIIYVFTKQPWFYFQNTLKGFKLIYFWEYVIDQLAILHDFFVNARLDKKTNKIYWPNNKSQFNFWSNFASFAEDENAVSVGDYLKENKVRIYADFYALSFDYHVKMFNEGILLKDLAKANKYISEIEYILDKLKDTPREADYTVIVTVCKDVLSILRKKKGAADYSNFADYMDSSKNGGGHV